MGAQAAVESAEGSFNEERREREAALREVQNDVVEQRAVSDGDVDDRCEVAWHIEQPKQQHGASAEVSCATAAIRRGGGGGVGWLRQRVLHVRAHE